ncbi:MAG: hypothetical protein P8X74_22950 [Reinekea sp.]|jgi:hypothetical protein
MSELIPDLYFDISDQSLTWPAKGLSWKAESGPHGDAELPPGMYLLGRREISQFTKSIDKAYKDNATGYGFFIPIYPQFETDRGRKGGRLGIHPDGNIPGTEGCIGLKASTKAFYDVIGSTAPSAIISLKVTK